MENALRLFTRADFDGLVCAALLEELGIVDEIIYMLPPVKNGPTIAGRWTHAEVVGFEYKPRTMPV